MNPEIIHLEDLRRRCAGKAKTMVRVLDSFINSSEDYKKRLKQQETAANLEQLAKTLHTIKGLLREIAAQHGAEYVQSVETKVKQNSLPSQGELEEVEHWIDNARRSAQTARESLLEEDLGVDRVAKKTLGAAVSGN